MNQEGGCRWCRVTDWTIRNNTIVHVGAGFGFAGHPERFPVDSALRRIKLPRVKLPRIDLARLAASIESTQAAYRAYVEAGKPTPGWR